MKPEEKLINKISSYMSKEHIEKIKSACDLAIKSHGSQLRNSGEPYYYHPVEVAIIIADMNLDYSSIVTALLHDTLEDTYLKLEDIENQYGSEISTLVDGVTKLTKIENQSENIRQAENFRKLLLAMSNDIRVLLIKLADRLHNMRTIEHIKSHEKRNRIAHETMDIYGPLAERIGMQSIKIELQDLAFAELYPETRLSIKNRLDYLRKQGNNVMEKVVDELNELLKNANIKGAVSGREKLPFSIWQKMERKNIGFEQLSDIMAFRVLVDSTEDCYRVLGLVHFKYHMVPDTFKDFISTPKFNGYQSLHTVVVGPQHQRVEIQIRTYLMHEVAELGVAAHWSYKQNYNYNLDGDQYRWLKELLEILEQTSDPEEFLENTKMEMYYNQVFCFTPKGKLIALPKGATPVDFAYSVHSDVGNSCVGAKINGRIATLKTLLCNGDQVEIIRSKTASPSASWEKFVVTGKARAKIKKMIRNQKKHEYIELGRSIISKSFQNEGFDYADKELEPILEYFKKKSVEDLLSAIGEGLISKTDVIKVKFPENTYSKSTFSFLNFKKKKNHEKIRESYSSSPIKGLIDGMNIYFGKCCHPIPGDNIVGIVHTGKGVSIHSIDCQVLDNFSSNPERWLSVFWEKDHIDSFFEARIKLMVTNEPLTLANLTGAIAKGQSNIINLKIITRTVDFFELVIDMQVKGISQLNNIISNLKNKPYVYSVERYRA